MSELTEYSKNIKSIAQEILDKTNIVKILNKYGEVIIGGSYKYDLMWGPDIDINVICKDTRESSVATLSELIDLRLFQKYEYGDFVKFPRENRIKSYIMPLILPYNNQKWEIEVWFFDEYPTRQQEIDELIDKNLTEESKETILKLKQQRDESGDSKHAISSTDIYKQVLINGIKDYSDIIIHT